MVAALVDSSIVVDLLRRFPLAEARYARQQNLGLTYAVWLEVLEGAQNKPKQTSALRYLRDFEIVEVTQADLKLAAAFSIDYHLSHGPDAFDCLIAATSFGLQVPLYTRNIKHFRPMIGTLAIEPYKDNP